jgi:hypothetical protein
VFILLSHGATLLRVGTRNFKSNFTFLSAGARGTTQPELIPVSCL